MQPLLKVGPVRRLVKWFIEVDFLAVHNHLIFGHLPNLDFITSKYSLELEAS